MLIRTEDKLVSEKHGNDYYIRYKHTLIINSIKSIQHLKLLQLSSYYHLIDIITQHLIINNIYYLGYPTYIVPLVIIPPIPDGPYFVFSKIPFKSISELAGDILTLVAIIAGSNA